MKHFSNELKNSIVNVVTRGDAAEKNVYTRLDRSNKCIANLLREAIMIGGRITG